ncbi:transcriptional regulator [Rhodococcus sp. PD04]|uniref:transcriptional regulator n=1 Tax=Rhodococcus sp. PD04 TaxID=3109594 RepID=UPI002DD7FE14|nr:transcriptional regulator [Rhodococcus sp. PD04]WSE25773.1 transcriptional regulator [Rhodococcus sp. PD04]
MLPTLSYRENTTEYPHLSRRQAADQLQISPGGIDRLLDSGYLPDLSVQRIWDLSKRGILIADGCQPVLRQGLMAPADDDPSTKYPREFMGESKDLNPKQVVEADQQWWRCEPQNVENARFLPVTISGFPVTVLKIHRVRDTLTQRFTARNGREMTEIRYSFEAELAGRVNELGHLRANEDSPEAFYVDPTLSDAERERVLHLLKGRSTAQSGGPIAYLPNA